MNNVSATIMMTADIIPETGRTLRAGKLTLIYDRGNIRHINYGNVELVNMFYGAVRLNDWSTPAPVITDEIITENIDGFTIQYKAGYHDPGTTHQLYKSEFRIEGKADSSVYFSMKGTAITDFTSNRIGICVLHPVPGLAGNKIRLGFADGSSGLSMFPQQIAPHQPFTGFRSMQWRIHSDELITLNFEGAVFETEDQRNWSDYSFKTYSGPLSDPWPFKVAAGDSLLQSVSLHFSQTGTTEFIGDDELLPDHQHRVQQLSVSLLDPPEMVVETKLVFPFLGFGLPTNLSIMQQPAADCLRHIHFNLFRLTLDLADPSWENRLLQGEALAADFQVKLELVLLIPKDDDILMNLFVTAAKKIITSLYSVLPVSSSHSIMAPELFLKCYQQLRTNLVGVKIGYGTCKYFADLNRHPPAGLIFDFLQFGLSPQVHAFDTLSILENLPALPQMISNAERVTKGASVHVSPLCFDSEFTPSKKDDRNNSSLQACWFLKAIGNLAGAQVASLFDLDAEESFLTLADPVASPLYKILQQLKKFNPVYVFQARETGQTLSLENSAGARLEIHFPSEYNR